MYDFTDEDIEELIQELGQVEDKTEDSDPVSIDKILKIAQQHRKLGNARCCRCEIECMDLDDQIFKFPVSSHHRTS